MENKEFHCKHAMSVKENMPKEELCSDIADFYKIFSDTTRVKILFTMLNKEICVHDMSKIISMSQSSVSHQLRILRQYKVVKVRKQGKTSFYSLDDDHIHNVLMLAKEHLSE